MQFLTDAEARDVAAMAERVFPAGPDGPGAGDLHVLAYIDGQLAGPWGQGAGMYRQGPFPQAAHEGHGWQSPLTPSEVYRSCLAALARHCGRPFAELDAGQQDSVLADLEADRIDGFDEVSGADFFRLLRRNVVEGLFSDPRYGGNHLMLGWRWLGYPGAADAHGADYGDRVDRYGEPYPAAPRSLP